MNNKVKKGLFIIIFIILWLPFLQSHFPFFTSSRLDGFFTNAPEDTLLLNRWWDGNYQKGTNDYLNDHIGFRPELIRTSNQFNYSLFTKLQNPSIIIGKGYYLYHGITIKSYYGADYMGYDTIVHKLQQLKAIQDTLEALGKTVVLIHAPNKVYYYPEYIPDEQKSTHIGTTNYAAFKRIGDSLGIHQLDFNAWYCSLKNKGTELLYPKQAFHWSVYGSLLAADTFERYIEHRRNIRMPHPVWHKIIHTTSPRFTDDDISNACDMIFPATTETFSYPDVGYPVDATMTKPKVIYIGDSFILTWIYDKFLDNAHTDWQAWYYFKYVYDKNHFEAEDPVYVGNTDWIGALKKSDCIVLMYTANNLTTLGNDFIEKTYSYFYPKKKEGLQ